MPFFSRPPITRSKPRRRREDGDALPTLSFDVESVEFVPAGEEIGLLRLAGRWIAPAERVLHEVSLVAADGGELTHVQPLPDPSGSVPTAAPDGRAWRAAFSMNTAVALGESSAFMLRVGAEESVRLPRPGDMPEIEQVDEPAASAEPVDSGQGDGENGEADGGEVARLQAELGRMRTELEVERRRHASLEEEIRSRTSLENDLRNALAMQEAELAAAVAQAAQRARRAERQRERVTVPDGAAEGAARPLDADLIARIESARRASDAA